MLFQRIFSISSRSIFVTSDTLFFIYLNLYLHIYICLFVRWVEHKKHKSNNRKGWSDLKTKYQGVNTVHSMQWVRTVCGYTLIKHYNISVWRFTRTNQTGWRTERNEPFELRPLLFWVNSIKTCEAKEMKAAVRFSSLYKKKCYSLRLPFFLKLAI